MTDQIDRIIDTAEKLGSDIAQILSDQAHAAYRQKLEAIAPKSSPLFELRQLVNHVLVCSIRAGWIDSQSYHYQLFICRDLMAHPDVVEALAIGFVAKDYLNSHDIAAIVAQKVKPPT